MNEEAQEPRCKDCKHWFKKINPADLSEQLGQCRFKLEVAAIPRSQGLQTMVFYPDVPAEFPACGQYKQRVELVG